MNEILRNDEEKREEEEKKIYIDIARCFCMLDECGSDYIDAFPEGELIVWNIRSLENSLEFKISRDDWEIFILCLPRDDFAIKTKAKNTHIYSIKK